MITSVTMKNCMMLTLLVSLFVQAVPPTLEQEMAGMRSNLQPGMMINLKDIMPARSSEQLFNDLLTLYPTIVIDFSAPWCGPCRALAPHFENAAKELPFLLIKIDTDVFKEIARSYDINSIPTIVCFKQGHVIARFTGSGFTKSTLVSKLKTIYS